MMNSSAGYADTAERLVERIVALGPVVLTLATPWELFGVPGFACRDLGPSLAQAGFALSKAKSILEVSRRAGSANEGEGTDGRD